MSLIIRLWRVTPLVCDQTLATSRKASRWYVTQSDFGDCTQSIELWRLHAKHRPLACHTIGVWHMQSIGKLKVAKITKYKPWRLWVLSPRALIIL